MLRNAKELEHHELRARDGKIGHVQDFFFDDVRWTVRYLVVDTGTWLNSRKVLISPVAVRSVEWEGKLISVELTQEQVRNSPGIDTEQPVSREHEAALTSYYDWPAYWGAAGFPDIGFAAPISLAAIDRPEAKKPATQHSSPTAVHEDHHMRSVRAVTGHAVEASDGSIGHVHDFLIDDRSWAIRYLIIDTRNWWPGKKVLVSPRWIREVGWNESKVYVELTRAAVKASPAYDAAKPPGADYTDQLHDHYGQPRHVDE
jgi:uncharacterized protein YrrD